MLPIDCPVIEMAGLYEKVESELDHKIIAPSDFAFEQVFEDGKTHMVPTGQRAHHTLTTDCPCQPRVSKLGNVVIHSEIV